MTETTLAGAGASPGIAVGVVRRLRAVAVDRGGQVPHALRVTESEVAEGALRRARRELTALAARLRDEGRLAEAEIVETSVLMSEDPGLRRSIIAAVLVEGCSADVALVKAADEQADVLAALDAPELAARADDVRSIGRRAARLVANPGGANDATSEQGIEVAAAILVADDLGPGDVAELEADVCGVALARGAVCAHAAIVARALGIPMVVAVGDGILDLRPGTNAVVDGSAGSVTVSPSAECLEAGRRAMRARAQAREVEAAASALPSVTTDGHHVRMLANAASPAEVRAGLEVGAEGVGLIRTELPFLEASTWPSEDEHLESLEPLLAPLRGRTATVRVLDLGGDKTPPFLSGRGDRGLRVLFDRPEALSTQLRAIVRAGSDCDLRVLLPMVTSPLDVILARAVLDGAVEGTAEAARPRLGAMIETPEAVATVDEIASSCDFLSVGTNDLTHFTLASDRFAAVEAAAHHPRVLAAVDRVVRAAHAVGITVEVCGEAASDPVCMPLLVGLGVDELSVGAARVGIVRQWVRELCFEEVSGLARQALDLSDPAAVAQSVEPVAGRLWSMESEGSAEACAEV